MTLTKQQKLDLIYDVELRSAKEKLAEQYVKNMSALENSDKPLRTLQEIVHGPDQGRVEKSQTPPETERAIFDPEILVPVNQNDNALTSAEKELLEQSEIAAKTAFKKSSLDSKSQWEFTGIETLAMHELATEQFDLQEQFENAQSMSANNNVGMEL